MSDTTNLETLATGVAEGFSATLSSLLGRDAEVHSQGVQTNGATSFLSGIQGSWLVTHLQGVRDFPVRRYY